MKRLAAFTFLISVLTAASFWGSQKICVQMKMRDISFSYGELGLKGREADIFKQEDRAFRRETNRVCSEICKGRMEFLDLLGSGAGAPELERKLEEIGRMQVAMEKNMARHMLDVKKRLPPDKGQAYLAHLRQQLERSMNQCVHE